MNHYEYVRFEQKYAWDFRGVILPDVLDQLLQCNDFEDESLVCGAVLDGETPVGAAVAQLLTGGEVYLHSLYIAPEHRRKRLACGLMDRIMTEAREAYGSHNVYADSPVNVFLHTEYVLPREEAEGLASFLRAYGFRDFLEKDPCYLFTSDRLKESSVLSEAFTADFHPDPAVCSVSAIAGEAVSAAARYLDSFSIEADPDYLFILRHGDEIPSSMMAVCGGENEFSLSAASERTMDPETYLSLLKALLQALHRENPEFSLIVSRDRSGEAEFWARVAQAHGKVFTHTEAGMYIVFE